jgi:hypothetical protein
MRSCTTFQAEQPSGGLGEFKAYFIDRFKGILSDGQKRR